MPIDYAVNIMQTYKRATPVEVADGTGWYARAREIALQLYPDDVWRGAGVLATLSPMKEWSENVRLARLAVATGKATGNVPSATIPCQKILDGMSWDDAMNGQKTRSFCIAIATGGRGEVATVDAHAHDAAVGQSHKWADRPTITKGKFNDMDYAYREVADYLGISVNDLQAIVWVVWKREKKNRK